MSSRREVLIRILALLQRKTLIETKNRTLKWHYWTVRSIKNVALLTEDGAFALSLLLAGGIDWCIMLTWLCLFSETLYSQNLTVIFILLIVSSLFLDLIAALVVFSQTYNKTSHASVLKMPRVNIKRFKENK